MSTYRIDIVGACERIVQEAETLAGENYAYNLKKKNGALDFITSPENGSVDSTLISYQQGKKIAKLHLFYDQRTKACEITDNCDANVCDEGSTPVRKEATITIDNCIKTPVRQYSNDDMVALCKDTATFMRTRGLSDLRAAHEFFTTRILAEMLTRVGKNVEWDGSETAAGVFKDIQLINSNLDEQRVPLPGNWAEVMLDYENNQFTGTPAVIGQGNLQMFYKLHGYSCCNSTTPYGEADIDGDARFYLDQSANAVFGPDKFVLAAYNILHLLTFNENRNIDISTPTEQHVVIPDPFGYPFSWNLDFYFDNCTKTWKSQYSIVWGVFSPYDQGDAFAADGESTSPDASPDCNDVLDGVTGLWGYRATAA